MVTTVAAMAMVAITIAFVIRHRDQGDEEAPSLELPLALEIALVTIPLFVLLVWSVRSGAGR